MKKQLQQTLEQWCCWGCRTNWKKKNTEQAHVCAKINITFSLMGLKKQSTELSSDRNHCWVSGGGEKTSFLGPFMFYFFTPRTYVRSCEVRFHLWLQQPLQNHPQEYEHINWTLKIHHWNSPTLMLSWQLNTLLHKESLFKCQFSFFVKVTHNGTFRTSF